MRENCLVLGAGPAGITAAWELAKLPEVHIHLLEADSQVGGISRTVVNLDWRFDIGGHRFFSKSSLVNSLWEEMLTPQGFLVRPRKSRIYYQGKFFAYPLKPLNALINLGLIETFRCIVSYLWVRVRPPSNQSNFEGWVAARFGWRLYRIFFKTYTEKVWGIKTTELQSTWASQRIKNLSLVSAIKNAFGFTRKNQFTSLIEEFKYPELGPGQLWESAVAKISNMGHSIELNNRVKSIHHKNGMYYLPDSETDSEDKYKAVFSSLPLCEVPSLLDAPREILLAAKQLRYRDFIIVCLPILQSEGVFDDNWIYVHDSAVRVGRIQNYGSWSPKMVKSGTTCLGMEYFVNMNDDLWNLPDASLIDLARQELLQLGFVFEVIDSATAVLRVPKAYPVYDKDYQTNVSRIKEWLRIHHPNWFQIGRNGQHRYNNQDHSMLTAVHAVLNYRGNNLDYWNINLEDDYHEEISSSRQAPWYPSTD